MRYSAQQIFIDEINSGTCLGNDRCAQIVAEALSKLPTKVVDKVIEHCVVIMPDDLGAHTPKKYLKDVLIVLSERLLNVRPAKQYQVILHEVAHFYLGHQGRKDLAEMEIDEHEREAREFASKWNRKRVK